MTVEALTPVEQAPDFEAAVCPFCGVAPFVGPANPKREGNAFGYVECRNRRCAAQPKVEDGEDCADERGSDEYKKAAIRRWNLRHSAPRTRCAQCGGLTP